MTANFFDQVSQFQSGETVGPVVVSYPDYPRSAGWSLNVIIMGQSGLDCAVAATAGTSADSFSITIPAATTAVIKGGRKSFQIEVTKTGPPIETYICERGNLLVLWNPRVKTQEMIILESIRAVRAGFATDGQRVLAFDGIQLSNMTPSQLDSWEGKYIRIVNAQIGRAGGNGGQYCIKLRTPQDNRYAAPWLGPYPPPGGGH
jgi:hypothetical protein